MLSQSPYLSSRGGRATRDLLSTNASADLASVVDDLAVVRQLAGRMKRDLAAKLGDIADRRDDRFGARRLTRGHFDMQRHPVDAVRVVDDETAPHDLRMAPDD